MKPKKNQNKKEKKQKVNPELEGFKISINEFGEIVSTKSKEELNRFLDKNLYDKKLNNQQEEKNDEGNEES